MLGCFRGGQTDSYVRENNFPGQRPRSLVEDSSGRIWVGTEEGRLFQLAHGQYTTFAQTNGLPKRPIRSLYADADGSLWIGTIGGGLVLRRHDQFTIISTAGGLPDDDIYEILEDDAGRLWCGTHRGIFCVAKRDLLAYADGKLARVTTYPFKKSEGLVGISCLGSTQPLACKSADGRLWFATQQGVLALDAAAMTPIPGHRRS